MGVDFGELIFFLVLRQALDQLHRQGRCAVIGGEVGWYYANVLWRLRGFADLLERVIAEAEKEGGRPRGFALRPQITVKRDSTTRRLTSPNVLAILPGSDPVLRNEYVVMMGHLDHEGVDAALQQAEGKPVDLEKAPWGDSFGMCTDKFGVPWMVNCQAD